MTADREPPADETLAYHRGVRRAAAALAALRHPAATRLARPDDRHYPCSLCGSTEPTTPARLRRTADDGWAFAVWGWSCPACLPDTLEETP